MTDTLDHTAQQIASQGREALVARLRPAFERAAAAHSDILEIPPERLDQMIAEAADRADGLQWRRALAGVAMDQLGLDLGTALRHPAVARAQELVGAPSYEDAFGGESFAAVQPSSPAAVAPVAAETEPEWRSVEPEPATAAEPELVAPAEPEQVAAEPEPSGWHTPPVEQDAPAAETEAGSLAPEVGYPGAETPESEPAVSAGSNRPYWEVDSDPVPSDHPATAPELGEAFSEEQVTRAFSTEEEHGHLGESTTSTEPSATPVFPPPDLDVPGADAGLETAGSESEGESGEPAETGGYSASDPAVVHLPAVHLGGIANLAAGETGLELRFADPGLDIAREDDAVLGRISWEEIRSVEVSAPSRLRRRRDPEAKLVIRTERGDASFRIPGAAEDEVRTQLAPALTRIQPFG